MSDCLMRFVREWRARGAVDAAWPRRYRVAVATRRRFPGASRPPRRARPARALADPENRLPESPAPPGTAPTPRGTAAEQAAAPAARAEAAEAAPAASAAAAGSRRARTPRSP